MKDLRTNLTQAQKVIMASDFGEEDLDAEEALAEVESEDDEAAAQFIGSARERAKGSHGTGKIFVY